MTFSASSKPKGYLAVSRSQPPCKRSARVANTHAFTPDLQPAPLIPGPGPHIYSSSRRRNAASQPEPNFRSFDYVVVGSGIAGLTYALKVAEYGSVAVITKEEMEDGCTQYAQGGVCAVLDPLDSVERHAHDTMVACGFLNDRKAVNVVCHEGAERVLELADLGAQFTKDPEGKLHLTREGGHTARRIVHAADTTGAEITRALVVAARAHPNIDIFEHHTCVDLVTSGTGAAATCLGVDVMDGVRSEMVRFVAPCTMLASGGAGQLYPTTTNPDVVTGDGIAMAWRANAAVANMEFVQFHPTALAAGRARGRCFLVSEAVRGEGGILTNADGYRFMPQYDARLELAPRDVVARAIQDQMLRRGEPHVLLDVSHKPSAETLAHFPAIAAHCRGIGIDITQAPIPVAPAQHYLCGGVSAGLHGETSLPGLFACGEVACSGLHGANRLASNSLLEGLVFGGRAVAASLQHAQRVPRHCLIDAKAQAVFAQERAVREPSRELSAWIGDTLGTLRDTMWANAGITRTDKGLSLGFARLSALDGEVAALVATYGVSRELSELRSLVTCGQLVLRSAMLRRESRGLHYNADVPEVDEGCAAATQLQLRPAVAEPVSSRSVCRSVSVRHNKGAEVSMMR